MTHLQLFVRFVAVSVVAFGGGQAALPLVERLAVHDTAWLTPSAFGTAVAFSYVTPGPVLIIATFVGYQVAGVLGALAATIGAFLAPGALAALAARQVTRFAENRRVKAFGAAAAPAVAGVLGVTVVSLGRETIASAPLAVLAVAIFALARWTRLHPAALLGLGGLAGYFIGR